MTAFILLPIELMEEVGTRTVLALNGDEIPEIPLLSGRAPAPVVERSQDHTPVETAVGSLGGSDTVAECRGNFPRSRCFSL